MKKIVKHKISWYKILYKIIKSNFYKTLISFLQNILKFLILPFIYLSYFFKHILLVIKTINENKKDFFFWSITSFGIALFSIWLPFIIEIIINLASDSPQKVINLYQPLLSNNPYIMYSITFLSETLLSTILRVIEKKEDDKSTTKLVMGLFVLFYIIILSILSYRYKSEPMVKWQQHWILGITIFLGFLLYPLKAHFPSKTAENVESEQNEKVESIVEETEKKEKTKYVEEGVVYLNGN